MQEIPGAASPPPLLIVLSGPSGVGKDSALDELKKLDRPWHFAVTATTRPPRSGEEDGVDYIFLDAATFLGMKDRGEFLECAQVYDHWYGVPRSQVREALQRGQDVFLKIDVQGAATVRSLAPEAVFIFMAPGSLEELAGRLSGRKTETSAERDLRLATAKEELAHAGRFDYCLVNRDGALDETIARIDAIITTEKCRVAPRRVESL